MKRIAILGLGALVVATDGTLVIGLLRQIAGSLHVSASAAGQAVTVFAVVYAIGSPLLVRALHRAQPKRVLVAALALFVGANMMTAAAPSLAVLLVARVLAATSAGVFMPMAALVAAHMVPLERQARALAVIVGGASAATAVSVPLGTLVGGAFGWRTAFYAIAVITALVVVGLWILLDPGKRPQGGRLTKVPQTEVLLTLTTTLVWAAGSFTLFTYIALVLHKTAGIGTGGLALFLLIFGVTGIGGAAASGWLTDRKGAFVTLILALGMVAVALGSLGAIAATGGGHAVLSAAAVAAYGIGTWAVMPPQQKRLIGGGDGAFLLSLNASALYGGVAFGSALGALLLNGANSIPRLCFVAAALEVCAIFVAGLAHLTAARHGSSSHLPASEPSD